MKYNIKQLESTRIISGLSLIESALFRNNGYHELDNIKHNFPDYFSQKSWLLKFLKGMYKLEKTDLFLDYINNNLDKKYCIIGDYDADGIMATSIMEIGLKHVGVDVFHIIPDRLEDGYGLRENLIDRAKAENANVIITVDNGISAIKEVEYAKSLGFDVIITDHHLPSPDGIPNADIVINPHIFENDDFKDICGAFVALKLVYRLFDSKVKANEYILSDLGTFAALATVSDMMPMINENRLLVKYALENINFIISRNIWSGRTMKFISGFGNKYLIEGAKNSKPINEDSFGFVLGPTINASGRVNGEVSHIVDDIVNSINNGVFLNGYYAVNRERQIRTKEIYSNIKLSNDKVNVVVLDESAYDYPIAGIIGLIANKISEVKQAPSFVGVIKDNSISFSCRSIPGYSLHEGFHRIKESRFPITGGGHDAAMGIHLHDIELIDEFKKLFTEDFEKNYVEQLETVFELDTRIDFEEIFEIHRNLAPFGKGFNSLKFIYKGPYKGYDKENRTIQVGDLLFNTFYGDSKMPKVGTDLQVVFTLGIDDNEMNYFKLERVIEPFLIF